MKAYIEALPKRGYGQLAKIAKGLEINPSIVTLVLKGKAHFTPEQASDFAEYLGLSDLETDYLLAMVGHERAGKDGLRRKLKRQLDRLRAQALDIKSRMPPKKEITEEVKALFYSQWFYSAIRILSSVDKYDTIEEIAAHLGLPRAKVKDAMDFLVAHELCVEKKGRFSIGPQSTHVGADSRLAITHHRNWRQRAIFQLDSRRDEDLFFTSPVSIATKDIPEVRRILMAAIEEAFRVIDPSDCEEVACLNVDWFRY